MANLHVVRQNVSSYRTWTQECEGDYLWKLKTRL